MNGNHKGALGLVLAVGLGVGGYMLMKRSGISLLGGSSGGSGGKPSTTPPPTTSKSTGVSSLHYSFQSCPMLQQGFNGTIVRDLQTALTGLGYNPSSNIDGIFGPITAASVKKFQSASNIMVDGIVGPQTYGALSKAMSAGGGSWYCGTVPEPTSPYSGGGSSTSTSSGGSSVSIASSSGSGSGTGFPSSNALPKYVLANCAQMQYGSRTGPQGDVSYIQATLGYLGFNPKSNVDGIFGPITETAVKNFQSAEHIQVDGIVGPQTYHALNEACVARGGYFKCMSTS